MSCVAYYLLGVATGVLIGVPIYWRGYINGLLHAQTILDEVNRADGTRR
jgi:hypothetical protein